MSANLCRFSLVYAPWLVWPLLVVGAIFLVLGVWKLLTSGSSGTLEWLKIHVGDIHPLLLILIGLVLVAPGAILGPARYDDSFAHWVGDKFHFLVDQQDAAVLAELNDKPLGQIVEGFDRTGLYAIRVSPAAGAVKITGKYTALCDADLIDRICHQDSQKLTCDTDASAKIIRICTKSDAAACTARTL